MRLSFQEEYQVCGNCADQKRRNLAVEQEPNSCGNSDTHDKSCINNGDDQ
ncbi:Uncharacterised protein [Lautropia mirabilis]|nr:Uncharacterised protein [Lautropia mirabilis]